jgi:putative DNA primase/helicase
MTRDTLERAQHRWREILPLLGVGTQFLTNKHSPCPLCGGCDRFRYDDRDGSGSYICGQCGAGVGIIMVRKLKGWDHKTACDEIDRILGEIGYQPASAPSARTNGTEGGRLARVQRALEEARSPRIVETYLRRRGLSVSSDVLRGDARCPYFDDKRTLVGRYPAVVAPITGPDGFLQSAQRIYDADVGPAHRIVQIIPAGEPGRG